MIFWSGHGWHTQQPWGLALPTQPVAWYDQNAVALQMDGSLHLGANLNPLEVNGVTYPYGIGLVSCDQPFRYGRFTIEAKLPNSEFAWPAFWLWGGAYGAEAAANATRKEPDTYNEIDIFEGYANKHGSYFKLGIPWWKVQANTYPPNKPKSRVLWWNPASDFHAYELLWTPKTVTIWYDKKLVLVRDLVIDQSLNLVINNNVRNAGGQWRPSNFVVRSFTYNAAGF